MSQQLGPGWSIPTTLNPGLEIPDATAPQGQLQVDQKFQIPGSNPSNVDTYKLLASSLDATPGYLIAKIDTDQFDIVLNKLALISLNGLDTDDLDEGSTNLYYTISRFNASLATKTTDDLAEGVSNRYYSTSLFDSRFGEKTTTDLTEGSNLYFTNARAQSALLSHTSNSSIHLSNLSSFTTDNLAQGSTNLYLTSELSAEISANTSWRHQHLNKSTLDTYNFSNANALDAIVKKHEHTNFSILENIEIAFTTAMYNKYEGYTSNLISSATTPLVITDGVLSHNSTDGYKHVPSNSAANQYDVLISGASAGIYSWANLLTTAVNAGMFEASPSTAVNKTLRSAYINTHVSNGTTDVKHVTDANLTYINTTIPAHIASITLHVPSFTPVTDRGKFLYINTSDALAWTTTATNVLTDGENYISSSGDTITANKIRFTNTEIVAGDNITIDTGTDTISASWRPIDNTATNGNTSTSISSDWAYDHKNLTGNEAHIPTTGTTGYFLAWDGTFKDPGVYATGVTKIYKVTLNAGGSSGDIDVRLTPGGSLSLPSGWSGAKDTVTTDLNLTHNLALDLVDVTIFSDDGTNVTKLIGSAAYGTIISNAAKTITKITSLATINQKIHIYLQYK